tara:strand:+ start:158 stop:529 length:372 start_codon:yes stop_codon:yes gene_type:complete
MVNSSNILWKDFNGYIRKYIDQKTGDVMLDNSEQNEGCACGGNCQCAEDFPYEDSLVTDYDLSHAKHFITTMRGRFIISKALWYGIQELEKVEGVYQEVSDIEDMKYLLDTLFTFPKEILTGH